MVFRVRTREEDSASRLGRETVVKAYLRLVKECLPGLRAASVFQRFAKQRFARVVNVTQDHMSKKSYDTTWKNQLCGMCYRAPHAIQPDRH